MVFMSIFNFLEPGVTIIAQAIPMFRVLVVKVKNGSSAVRISSPTGLAESGSAPRRTWNSKASHGHLNADEELLHVRLGPGGRIVRISGPEGSDDDLKVYDARSQVYDGRGQVYDGQSQV
jgi:hypothetical protein